MNPFYIQFKVLIHTSTDLFVNISDHFPLYEICQFQTWDRLNGNSMKKVDKELNVFNIACLGVLQVYMYANTGL